jgi:two-component system, OmpR family, sensor histidine kinase TctE
VELRLQEEPGAGRAHIRGQQDLLFEALGNLLDNAIQYTPAGGVVTLSVSSEPPALIVSDTGPGIPAAEQERVFERFQRGSTAQGAGSGLGLAIVREIAALHGARAQLFPAAGGGTSVELRFADAAEEA